MRHLKLALVLLTLLTSLSVIAADSTADRALVPEAGSCDPSATPALGWEFFDFEAELAELVPVPSMTCVPDRQCTTQADCGEFGQCAVWRLCICFG